MLKLLLTFVLLVAPPTFASAQAVTDQITEAVLALPEAFRDGATVVTLDSNGERLAVLREGTNEFVCEADGSSPGFTVFCTHESLEHFRQLVIQGLAAGPAGFGRIVMAGLQPGDIQAGAIEYVLSGPDLDSAELTQVIFLPNATPDSTGLPTEPKSDVAWLMSAGTPVAHVMVGPIPWMLRQELDP